MRSISYGFLLHEMHKKRFSWCLKKVPSNFFLQLSFNVPYLLKLRTSLLQVSSLGLSGSLGLRNRHVVCVMT